MTKSERPLLVQAPVKALDTDGISVTILGTSVFAAASVLLALNLAWLRDQDTEWWLWVACTGTALGLLGLAYSVWRRKRRRSRAA